jgi:hypothetical protein
MWRGRYDVMPETGRVMQYTGPSVSGMFEGAQQGMGFIPASVPFSTIFSRQSGSRCLYHIPTLRGSLEIGEGGFVLEELDKSGRGFREYLPSAPISLLAILDSPRGTPSIPHRHNTHTPC